MRRAANELTGKAKQAVGDTTKHEYRWARDPGLSHRALILAGGNRHRCSIATRTARRRAGAKLLASFARELMSYRLKNIIWDIA